MESLIKMKKVRIMIAAVVYKQKLEDTNVYRSLLAGASAHGVTDVYIQDNGPEGNEPDGLPSSWRYVIDSSNPGLSAAYNRAAEYGLSVGCDYMLIADQDTVFPKDYMETLRNAIETENGYEVYVPNVIVGNGMVMSPVVKHGYMASLSPIKTVGQIALKRYAVINSGLCVCLGTFRRVGGYREEVPLDFADFQFCERLAADAVLAYAMDAECRQNFSALEDTPAQMLARFDKFCRSVKGYESNRRFGKQELMLVVLKRAASLMVKTRSVKPLTIIKRSYL